MVAILSRPHCVFVFVFVFDQIFAGVFVFVFVFETPEKNVFVFVFDKTYLTPALPRGTQATAQSLKTRQQNGPKLEILQTAIPYMFDYYWYFIIMAHKRKKKKKKKIPL